ncbi:MAG: adenine deaminase [Anaerolineales bacterium]|nr:adenine deaminase [Anaerolineales bacterium]
MDLASFVKIAHGRAPADRVLANARLINVLTGEIYLTDIALAGTRIAGLGAGYTGRETVDLGGRYVCPGFIDAHVHIESALVPPREFARAVLPHGVTSVVTDPHEIANVLGLEGIRFMLDDAKHGALSMYVNAPSCVPATHLETAGAQLEFYDLAPLLREPWVLGLAEVMNYPGVTAGDPRVLAKLRAFAGRVIDGHGPRLSGAALNAYVAAGIMSDHECVTVDEAREKLRLGLTVLIREATNAHNLRALLPLVTPANERRICFCTDDRQPSDLLEEGSIDFMIRTAIAAGLDPVTAIRLGTLNAAEYFRLPDRGAVAPGRRADLVIFSDLHNLRPEQVYRGGRLVAEHGRMRPDERPARPRTVRGTVNIDWSRVSLVIPAAGRRVRVIGLIPDQIVTEHLIEDARREAGQAVADPARDLLKIAVIERHQASGRVGLGFVRGLGLKRGAVASTVAHDHHNLVVAGADDVSMLTAAQAAAATQGGLAVAEGTQVLARLPLPIAGLMSDQPIEPVRAQLDSVLAAAHQLGSPLRDPFMAMSFLALPVIPALKITDHGLVDVDAFQLTPLFAD